MTKLTQERLRELLYYDPDNGIFIRIISFGNTSAGNMAGSKDKNGYIIINIDKKAYKAHRLAWLYMEGYFPHGIEVDHIDRDPSNNKWNNLRLVSHACNMKNISNHKNNSSGVMGVSWDVESKKWKVYIQSKGNKKNVGRFKTLDNAVCCRLAAEQCLNWGKCNLISPAFKYVQKHINSKIK